MSRSIRYVLSVVALGFALSACAPSAPAQIDVQITPPSSANQPMVLDPVKHAADLREELLERNYVPAAPADYTTIGGEVVRVVRWVESTNDTYIDFLVNSDGLPFSMTDGVTRCEFVPGIPETILNLRSSWLLINEPVQPGKVDSRELINTINQKFTFTCAAAN